MNEEFFKRLTFKINDLIDEEQLSIGRVGHPFIVPKNYFKDLNTEILSKIKVESTTKHPFSRIYKNIKWISVAASISLIFGVLSYNFYFGKIDSLAQIESLDNEEIQAFIENQAISYTEMAYLTNLNEKQVVDLESENIMMDDLDYLESNENLIAEIEKL